MFKSYKLDDMQASKRKLEDLRASGGEHVYFAKFLTSEKVRGYPWCNLHVFVRCVLKGIVHLKFYHFLLTTMLMEALVTISNPPNCY